MNIPRPNPRPFKGTRARPDWEKGLRKNRLKELAACASGDVLSSKGIANAPSSFDAFKLYF